MILISIVLLPIYIHLSKQSLSLEREQMATNILYETILNEGVNINENKTITRGNNHFEIVWTERNQLKKQEVCVQYQDGFHQIVQKCKVYK